MGWIDVGGIALHLRAPRGVPPSGAPTVLCVHGAGGSGAQFDPVLARIASDAAPVAVDLPGHGRSEGVAPASIEAMADALAGFLAALELRGAVVCVGHSLGGLVALAHALRYPRRVSALVLVASGARVRVHPDFFEQARTGVWDPELVRRCFAAPVSSQIRDLVLNDLRDVRVTPGAWKGELGVRGDLGQIAVRAVCLVPLRDVILSPRHGRALAGALPGGELVEVFDAGHYVHLERPETVAAAIDAVLPATARAAPTRQRLASA